MDISTFDGLYFRTDLLSIEDVFKPYDYAKFGITSEDRLPFAYLSDTIFQNVFYHFAFGDGFDITYDCHTMDELKDLSNEELQNLDIEVDYSGFGNSIDLEKLKVIFGQFVELLKIHHSQALQNQLFNADTNIQANILLQKELDRIYASFVGLIEMDLQIELNPIQSAISKQFLNSYQSLFGDLGNSYEDSFPSKFKIYKAKLDALEFGIDKPRKDFGNGLILGVGKRVTLRRAETMRKSLVKREYLAKGTRADTLHSLFKKLPSQSVKTKVDWTSSAPELKYLINKLHENKVITESGFNKKWFDAANCFTINGKDLTNKSFSKNTDPIKKESAQILDRILSNFLEGQ